MNNLPPDNRKPPVFTGAGMSEQEKRGSPERRGGLSDLYSRMDKQDTMLQEIRDVITVHMAEDRLQKKLDEPAAKALAEIVLLWRASRIIIPALMGVVVGFWAILAWWKEHVKW